MDGEVARLQETASAQGALLDLTLDRASDVALLGGLAIGAGGRRIDWLLALAAANGIVTAGVVKERIGHEGEDVAELQQLEAVDGGLDTLVRYTGRDGRLFAVTLAGLVRQPRLALIWLAASSNWRLLRRLKAARALLRRRGDESHESCAYVPRGCEAPVTEPLNLARFCIEARALDPATADRPAFTFVRDEGDESWSYAELWARIQRTGRGLLARGLVAGDRVLLRLPH